MGTQRPSLVGLIVILLATTGCIWTKLPEYTAYGDISLPVPIMTGTEYGAVIDTHPRPYIVEVAAPNGGGVLLYGATHTKDPNDPQIVDIEARWARFRPTVALCESRLGIMFPWLMDPVKTFSEPGAVHALARRDGISTYTWEPTLEIEMHSLLAQPFSKEQIAMFIVLRPYFSKRRFGRPSNPEDVVGEAVAKRMKWPGIEGSFEDVEAVEACWQEHYPDGPDWRDVSDEYGLPGFLGRIDGNLARDEHFARVVIDLVQRGERVFAVAGSSHAVKLDRTLRAALNESPD